jgi:hypothetical protein
MLPGALCPAQRDHSTINTVRCSLFDLFVHRSPISLLLLCLTYQHPMDSRDEISFFILKSHQNLTALITCRGWYLSLQSLFFTVGAVAVVGMSWFSSSWRELLFLAVLPSYATFFLNYLYLNESPRFLVTSGKHEEAKVLIISLFIIFSSFKAVLNAMARMNGTPVDLSELELLVKEEEESRSDAVHAW